MGQYRIAHLFIKAWAKARGIYSSKFGFLGGINISVMLVPICKMLALEGEAVSSSDVLVTFFHHYANTDWKTVMVFDPFFHKSLRYNRSFREPVCLLGWHAPSLNTAMNASYPTVKAMSIEFKRVQDLLTAEGMAWDHLLGSSTKSKPDQIGSSGAAEFLRAYRSYVKIDAHYWGVTPEKGSRFIGWLESRCVMLLVGKATHTQSVG
jgi:poly(A) polymerase Pap1